MRDITDKDMEKLRNAEAKFKRMDDLRIPPPGQDLVEQIDFMDHLSCVLKVIDASDEIRLIVLESWLLVDFQIREFIFRGLGLPECIDPESEIITSSFVGKLKILRRLTKTEKDKRPNRKSYLPYELSPGFMERLAKNKELWCQFMELAIEYEEEKRPPGVVVVEMNGEYEYSRFVPEWWIDVARKLDKEWYKKCRSLNDLRNISAHKMTLSENDIFETFKVSNMNDFRLSMKTLIKALVFTDAKG